ncbi:hypothetical protein LA080_014933 [Diaporthe eres]|nr:hypothetical protein LA080_014933 [Diaporthe eres]
MCAVRKLVRRERTTTGRCGQDKAERDSRHAWLVDPDKATELHKHRQRHESSHPTQACRGPTKRNKADVAQTSRAVAVGRRGNTTPALTHPCTAADSQLKHWGFYGGGAEEVDGRCAHGVWAVVLVSLGPYDVERLFRPDCLFPLSGQRFRKEGEKE